jgi:hypothetical protein
MFYTILYVVIFENKRYADERDGATNNSTNLCNFARVLLSADAELSCWQPCTPLSIDNNRFTLSALRVFDQVRVSVPQLAHSAPYKHSAQIAPRQVTTALTSYIGA